MKKSILKISIISIIIIMLIAGGFLITKLNMKFPDKATYGNGTNTTYCVDGGMYYIKNNCIYFLDSQNQINTAVCNKANCTHNNASCNAYVEGMVPGIICYGDYLYVSMFNSKISDEDGEDVYTGLIKLDCIKCDGSSRRTIYSADSGAVTSMKAIGDKLYFTAWTFHGDFVLNSHVDDHFLYEYDLRWNKLKLIQKYVWDENQEQARIEIVKGNARDLYVMYVRYNKDGSQDTQQLFKYDDDKMTVIKEYNIADLSNLEEYEDISFVINESEQFEIVQTIFGQEKDILAVSISNDCFQNKKLMFTVDDAHAHVMNGYMLVINSDYNKILLDCASMKTYIGTTAFEGETYISDIYDIDAENNKIYINTTDYTGILPGTIFYEDTSNQGVADFDVFMSNYFIDKASIDSDDMAKLPWVHYED